MTTMNYEKKVGKKKKGRPAGHWIVEPPDINTVNWEFL